MTPKHVANNDNDDDNERGTNAPITQQPPEHSIRHTKDPQIRRDTLKYGARNLSKFGGGGGGGGRSSKKVKLSRYRPGQARGVPGG